MWRASVGVQNVATLRRFVSGAANSKAVSSPTLLTATSHVSQRLQAKNALRAIANVLPRILDAETLSLEGWGERISQATNSLSADVRDPIVAVWSPRAASARDVVTSLLEDPFSSDDARRTSLARRWDNYVGEHLRISYSAQTIQPEPGDLRVASSWLHKSKAVILEISNTTPQSTITRLLCAHVQIIVVDSPADLLREDVRTILGALKEAGKVIVVANNVLCQSQEGRSAYESVYGHALETSLGFSLPPRIQLQLMSSEAAIDAQATFRREQLAEALQPSSSTAFASAVTRFQTVIQDSGLSSLSRTLHSSLSSLTSSFSDIAIEPSMTVSSIAIHRSHEALKIAQLEALEGESRAAHLRSSASAQTGQLKLITFSNGTAVSTALQGPRNTVQVFLDNLSIWKLPWRVDELASDVNVILISSYGRELERNLIYQTGRLSAVRDALDDETARALAFSPSSPLHSPLLANELRQLDPPTSLSSSLPPNVLLPPIQQRLERLTSDAGSPLAHLHRRAQILLLQAYALSIGGPAMSWGSWFAGYSGEELALGMGALSTVGGLRWAVGRWEKAKKKWWESWERVESGLERDLEARFDVVTKDVLAKSTAAANGLDALSQKQAESIQALSSEITRIAEVVDSISANASSPST